MLYRNSDGRYPSLVVADGKTVTLSGKAGSASGVPVLAMRPRTTASLLLAAGRMPPVTPRLSDPARFEIVDCTDGLVNLADVDEDGRVAGYSLPFLRGLLDRFDPEDRMPPSRVRALIPAPDAKRGCGCRAGDDVRRLSGATAQAIDVATLSDAAARKAGFMVRDTFVPAFLTELGVYSLVTRLGDIIVGRNATLILDADLGLAIADNFLCYHGARIVQGAASLSLDVIGTMRGSLSFTIHDIVSDTVKLNLDVLAKDLPTKP